MTKKSNYDPTKDKIIDQWESGKDENDLVVAVHQYSDGEPKVGFSRYIKRKDQEELSLTQAGRLNWDDIQFLQTVFEKIEEAMGSVK